MQLPLTGYDEVELLRATADTRVYAAVRRADGLAVVAKVVALGDELDALEARVEHEYALLSKLDCRGVVRPLGLERSGDYLVLLLERVPGVNLAVHAGGQALELQRFTRIALQIATVLARVHAKGVIHRDIKPTNILIEAGTEQVYLADFGISVLLERARRDVHDEALIEGTLPYLSPEQTGRTKRRVDFRSDLYSLGVTFYELLAGCRPFDFHEPLELIHAHLARQPSPLLELRPELPPLFERLVTKLMAKDPEARYQSAKGLASDLRALLTRLEEQRGLEGLELGASERSLVDRFAPIRQVRARELGQLMQLIGEAPSCEQAQLCVVSGEEGMGKSSLIDVLVPDLTLAASHVGRGSFGAQLESGGRPYAALIEAFGEIAQQLLTHSESELGRWRDRIERGLGEIRGVITELIPAFVAILGEPEPLPQLDPHAARNRLQLAFTRLCAALTEPARPLVLIIEQLERADKSSVTLLETLLGTPACAPLLILASASNHDPSAPAFELLARLGPEQLSTLELGPFEPAALEQALQATFGVAPDQLQTLQRLLERKTNNNPRFLRQLLAHLVETEQLQHDEQGWTWSPSLGDALELPDDFRALLTHKLKGLRPEQSELLSAAACIGVEFQFAPLAELLEQPAATLLADLDELIELGLVDRRRELYRFAHSSVCDTALARLETSAARTLHWELAQRQLARPGLDGPDELFALAEHLVAGAPDERELVLESRVQLAQKLTEAGRLALASAAHEPALRYFELALTLLEDASVGVQREGAEAPYYTLVIEVHHLHTQLLGVAGQVEAASRAYEDLLAWPLGVRERGRIAASWIALLHLEGNSRKAVELGLTLLEELGCPTPRAPSALRAKWLTLLAWQRVHQQELDQLLALPTCEDPRAQAVMEVLETTKNASYVVDPRLYMALIAVHVRLFSSRGLHPSAPLALAQLALSVGAGLGWVADATALAERAVELAPRCSSGQTEIRTVCAASLFVSHMGRPFSEPIARMRAIYPRALEAGDLLWAGYAGASSLSLHLEVGTHLSVLGRLCGELERELGNRVSTEAQLVARGLLALTTTLSHDGTGLVSTAKQSLAPLERERIEAEGGSRYSVYVAAANLALIRLLLGSPDAALALTLEIHADMEQVLFASWVIPRVAMTLIAAAAQVRSSGESESPVTASARRRASKIIQRWARGSRENYGHYVALDAGLRALERGRDVQAMHRLERARQRAASAGCRWVEGLSAEFLVLASERAGFSGYARGALIQAQEAYETWGARAKLAQLLVAHADLSGSASTLVDELSASRSGTWGRTLTRTHTTSTPRHSGNALDYDSVLRSVASITTELDLDEVIAKVLDAALTNAGSDCAILALTRGPSLELVAELELERGLERLEPALPLSEGGVRAPASLLRFVRRTGKALIVDDAQADPRFRTDPFIVARDSRSLLAVPLRLDEGILGVLVLENRQSSESFSSERFEALQLILTQAARALDHARTHAALRESELRWRSLVNQAPDLIALFDSQGQPEFVNHSNTGNTLPHTEVLAHIARSPRAQDWGRALAKVLDEGLRQELEFELEPSEQAPGRSSWWIARIAPIEGQAGPGAGGRKAIVIATDITQRKRSELERTRLQTQLRQQQRLESLGTLASGVAHEINNPVQGIMNYAELLGSTPSEPELVREFAGEIHAEAERVAEIVSSLLTFSRKERPRPLEPVALEDLLAQTLTLVRSIMRSDQIALSIDLPEGLAPLSCRPQQLRQVLLNLLTNARDALNEAFPQGSPHKRIAIRAQPRADSVCLTVEDWGPGIPPEVLEHIFDPFYTTKGRDQGTGLGLSLALGIVQDHGGELRVDSRLGEGTRFEIELPQPAACTG